MRKKSKIYNYNISIAGRQSPEMEHTGTFSGALVKAKRYANEAFPRWIKGYGPTLVVRDLATGERVEIRL